MNDVSIWDGNEDSNGSEFEHDVDVEDENGGGGGIIPCPESTLNATGRDIAISASVDNDAAGAFRFITFGTDCLELVGEVSEEYVVITVSSCLLQINYLTNLILMVPLN